MRGDNFTDKNWRGYMHNCLLGPLVLVMAEIELIFFRVAYMALCFGFLLNSVDNSGMF